MGALTKAAIFVLTLSFMTFVTFFGRLPVFRRTPIAFLHKSVWVYLPNGLYWLDSRLFGGHVFPSLSRFSNYMLYDKHPTVLIFFFLLLSVSEVLYLPHAWPRISTIHQILGVPAIIAPYLFLYLAAFGDPGYITADNHIFQMAQYPYDFCIFYPGQHCSTCRFLKPARSKHCRICKACIAKNDHHCIFINNCVGAGNQHWFLLLLLTTGILTSYGAVLGLQLIGIDVREREPGWSYWYPAAESLSTTQPMTFRNWLAMFTWGLNAKGMCSVTMLMALLSPMVWGLLIFNIYSIYTGATTNESLKWSDWKDEIADGYVFMRKMPENRVKDPQIEPITTRWPVEPSQTMIRTTSGRPPSPPDGTGSCKLSGVGDWEPVWSLRDVANLYDLGFMDNVLDIFWPKYRPLATNSHQPRTMGKRKAISSIGRATVGLTAADVTGLDDPQS